MTHLINNNRDTNSQFPGHGLSLVQDSESKIRLNPCLEPEPVV